MAKDSGSPGVAFVLGGLIVAAAVMAFFMSGGTFWITQPTATSTAVEIPASQ